MGSGGKQTRPTSSNAADQTPLACNHPLVDGHKRTAWVFARLFLALNNVDLRFAPEDDRGDARAGRGGGE